MIESYDDMVAYFSSGKPATALLPVYTILLITDSFPAEIARISKCWGDGMKTANIIRSLGRGEREKGLLSLKLVKLGGREPVGRGNWAQFYLPNFETLVKIWCTGTSEEKWKDVESEGWSRESMKDLLKRFISNEIVRVTFPVGYNPLWHINNLITWITLFDATRHIPAVDEIVVELERVAREGDFEDVKNFLLTRMFPQGEGRCIAPNVAMCRTSNVQVLCSLLQGLKQEFRGKKLEVTMDRYRSEVRPKIVLPSRVVERKLRAENVIDFVKVFNEILHSPFRTWWSYGEGYECHRFVPERSVR